VSNLSIGKSAWRLGRGSLVVGILALGGMGCAAGPASELTITSTSSPSTSFLQTFPTAYFTQDSDGDTDIVLVDDAARLALDGERSESPVRQVMHIRVLWKPTRDAKADHSSASNATIHWYVMGNSPKAADVIEYAGTAMIVLEPGDHETALSIRTASFRAVASRGAMHDPIGPGTLRGSVRATESLERVRLALKAIGTTVAAANSQSENAAARGGNRAPHNPDAVSTDSGASAHKAAARNAPELPSSSAR
jgi:hypothetical protein